MTSPSCRLEMPGTFLSLASPKQGPRTSLQEGESAIPAGVIPASAVRGEAGLLGPGPRQGWRAACIPTLYLAAQLPAREHPSSASPRRFIQEAYFFPRKMMHLPTSGLFLQIFSGVSKAIWSTRSLQLCLCHTHTDTSSNTRKCGVVLKVAGLSHDKNTFCSPSPTSRPFPMRLSHGFVPLKVYFSELKKK